MTDNKKLAKTIGFLLETHENSRHYMNSFYKCCKNGEIDDLEWIKDDEDFSDFIDNQDVEYIRIYDYAIMELSARLLKKLDIEI